VLQFSAQRGAKTEPLYWGISCDYKILVDTLLIAAVFATQYSVMLHSSQNYLVRVL